MTIGFIGLGIMGKPMALNLVRAGFELVVHNRSRGPADELAAAGARAESSAAAVAAAADVLITMLPDSPDVESVVLGDGAPAGALRSGSLFIDMSTIAPSVSRRIAAALAARGIAALDAPVSGGEKGAVEATLSIMAGGDAAAFERAAPIFAALGKNVVHIGGPGAGQVAKACNQIVVAVTIEAVAEAIGLAAASGVDPAKVRAALLGGFAQSRILDLHGQRMLDRAFAPGFKAKLHLKDMGIAVEAAAGAEIDAPAARLLRDRFAQLVARGDGERDHSALLELVEPAG
jgi:2-hydroxy-3-oxopropionate reductase